MRVIIFAVNNAYWFEEPLDDGGEIPPKPSQLLATFCFYRLNYRTSRTFC